MTVALNLNKRFMELASGYMELLFLFFSFLISFFRNFQLMQITVVLVENYNFQP